MSALVAAYFAGIATVVLGIPTLTICALLFMFMVRLPKWPKGRF